MHKTFVGKQLRAYVFTAQIIIKEMTERDFVRLGIPVKGTVATFPAKEYLPTSKEKTDIALKTAITQRMNQIKAQYEKKLVANPAREPVKLTATGNYKDTLSTLTELSK